MAHDERVATRTRDLLTNVLKSESWMVKYGRKSPLYGICARGGTAGPDGGYRAAGVAVSAPPREAHACIWTFDAPG